MFSTSDLNKRFIPKLINHLKLKYLSGTELKSVPEFGLKFEINLENNPKAQIGNKIYGFYSFV